MLIVSSGLRLQTRLVMLLTRIVAVATRVAQPVTESLTLNASMTLASVERASSTTMEHAKKVRDDSVQVHHLFKMIFIVKNSHT